ncbi:MAG TPA: hypothetical protein VF476_03845 [Chitinophagaceae bacterium]
MKHDLIHFSLKGLLLAFISIVISSCSNGVSDKEKDRILQNFDSIRLSLEKGGTLQNSRLLYDSLVSRLMHEPDPWRQFYYSVHDFYGYIDNVQGRFQAECGDSAWENNIEITNRFFADNKNTSAGLYGSLKSVLNYLHSKATDSATRGKISTFDHATFGKMRSMEDMKKVYFHNVPPVAVITILNSFEQKVRDLELLVLKEHYKIQ